MNVLYSAMKARFLSTLLGCLLLCLAGLGTRGVAQVTRLNQGTITTIAGVNTEESVPGMPQAATSTGIGNPSAIVMDADGNVYSTDGSLEGYVWLFYEGQNPPPLLTKLVPLSQGQSYVTGDAYLLVGGGSCGGGNGPQSCGEGLLASSAFVSLDNPAGLALDSHGNLYIADQGSQAIRRVDATSGIITTIAGDPMHVMPGYGGENVPAQGSLLNNPSSIAFDAADNLYVSDTYNYIIRKIDTGTTPMISTVAGTVPVGGMPQQCMAAPCGDTQLATTALLGYVPGIFVDGPGNIYLADSNANAVRRVDVGTKKINTVAGMIFTPCVQAPAPACGDGQAATSAQLNAPNASYLDATGNLFISDSADNAIRVVDTLGKIHTVIGQITATGGYVSDPGIAGSAVLNDPDALAVDSNGDVYFADYSNNIIRKVVPPTQLATQTITFNPPMNATYGQAPISLSATSTNSMGASTGISVTFTVTSGPGTISGSTLTITGAGPIVVLASAAANSTYGAATLAQTIMVAPATLTVTAPQNLPLKEGSPIPTLTAAITGFVNNDPISVVTGSPLIQVLNAGVPFAAGAVPLPGNYPIAVSVGTLAAPNYSFTYVPGELIVTRGLPQTLTFSVYTPPTVYGGANSTFTFSVISSAGLTPTVSFTPGNPVVLQPLAANTWSATVTGVGKVTFTATQAGDLDYARATQTSEFVVGPAVLTVPVANATRQYGAPNPTFTYNTPGGFIGADNSSVLSGLPSYTTTATPTSAPNTYPITATQGTLFAQNYSFVFQAATLTVTQATQQIMNFTAPANVVYGGSGYPLQASASSNLPVTYSSTGPVQIAANGATFQATGVGPATITATQTGNADYTAISATISFNVAQATQYVTAAPVSVSYDAAIPQLNWCFASIDATTKLPACDSTIALPTNLYSGTPAVTTTASLGSTPGTYPINVSAGTLTSSVYAFAFSPGTLTITPAATYTLSANPSSITLSPGQSGQSTITLTPINNYVGTVTIACSGLPAGVTCTADPAGLTTSLNSQGVASPVNSMLTISVTKDVAQNTMGGASGLFAAGMFGLPGLFAGILIFYRRTQFNQRSIFTGILLLVALGASTTFVTACGGGSSHSGGAQPGTTQIMITGSGAASAGAVSQSVGLTVTIQ